MSCLVSPAHYEIFKNTEKVKNKKSCTAAQASIPALRRQRLAFKDTELVSGQPVLQRETLSQKTKIQKHKTKKSVNKFLTATVALSSINDPPASARDYKHGNPAR